MKSAFMDEKMSRATEYVTREGAGRTGSMVVKSMLAQDEESKIVRHMRLTLGLQCIVQELGYMLEIAGDDVQFATMAKHIKADTLNEMRRLMDDEMRRSDPKAVQAMSREGVRA